MSCQASNKKSRLLALILCALSPVTAGLWANGGQTAQGKPAFRLEDGTPVKLRLQRTLSSADARVDDRVDFDVLEDVRVNEELVIPKGSVAWGTVTEAQAKRRMARGGKLNVNIDAVRLANGEKCPLRAVKEVKGGGHTGAMTAGIVATGLLVWPAAPFFLFMHGKDIVIPKGTEVTAYINGDMNLDPAKFASRPATEAQALPVPLTVAVEASTILVKSTPEGADITLNGKFIGSTPSSLRLATGDHSVSVEKSGFKKWQRTMAVSAGSNITLNATLEAAQPTNVVQVPPSPPSSATQPPPDTQIAPIRSDIQKRLPAEPTRGGAPTPPATSEASAAQFKPGEGITGTYEGQVRNETLGVTAGYRISLREENGAIYGCTAVQRPLSGSGGFTGSVNGSRVVFETEGKKFRVRFNGELAGDAMKGTYTVVSAQQHGEFALKRTSSSAPLVGFDTEQCRKD